VNDRKIITDRIKELTSALDSDRKKELGEAVRSTLGTSVMSKLSLSDLHTYLEMAETWCQPAPAPGWDGEDDEDPFDDTAEVAQLREKAAAEEVAK
jgi:hypothetical protein